MESRNHSPRAQTKRARGPRQPSFQFRTWGGARKGAGRKPSGERAGVSHLPRPELPRPLPIHVTLRVAKHVYNLRSQRSFRVIEKAFFAGADRFGTRVVRFAVLGNHLHLLVEADNKLALARALKGLSVRIARGLNKMMGKKGRVIGDRYHAHVLRTPTEVKRAIHYLRHNHRQHMAECGERLPTGWKDPYCSDVPRLAEMLPAPTTWLLREGWQRGTS